jgi:uncharacterized protein YjbI with pentapeptide repeats
MPGSGGAVNIINETPFTFARLMGKVVHPKDTITLIVKGTFLLKADAPAVPAPPDEQLPPTGDICHDDDPHATVRYESDFVHFKPRADVMLVGHCHVPGGQPAPACAVCFQAGPIAKSLMVFGDRTWRRNALGMRIQSDPEPFSAMALRYENSFGGPGYKRNPVGKGICLDKNELKHADNSLPNLKVLEGEQLATMQDGIPAGFGPLGRTWAQRMALVGRFGQQWKRECWPGLPKDFDWGYFNAAPGDQQVKGYLKGDEALYFSNLHPSCSEWRSALPGLRVRCFLAEYRDGRYRFREVRTQLDTLWVDMDEARLVLVWRGLATVASPECEQIEDILIVQEPLQEDPRPLEAYEQLLQERKAAAAAIPGEVEAPEMEAPAGPAVAAAAADAVRPEDDRKTMDAACALLRRAGLPPDRLAQLTAGQDPERFVTRLLEHIDIDPASADALRIRARGKVRELLARCRPQAEELLSSHGHDAAVLQEASALLEEEQAQSLKPAPGPEAAAAAPLGTPGPEAVQISGGDFSGHSLEGADFRAAQLSGASFAGARLAGADFTEAVLDQADFKGADLSGAKFRAADLSGASFDGARLAQADCADALLTGARLRAADLTGAKLNRALLERADLSHALLREADLEQADLSRATLIQADLTRARLAYAILDGADLSRALLRRAAGGFTSFNGCVMAETDCGEGLLEDCNFSNCRCDGAIFDAAGLARATFEGAAGRRVSFHRADLTLVRAGENVNMPGCIFTRARGRRSNWAGARLQGADFILAQMPACDFSQADLSGCDGRTSDLKHSRFDHAVLSDAKFNRANLFNVRLEGADLKGADFKGCNLFGSEFLNATIDKRTSFKAANLKGTKLADLKTG